jgi:hypothetical protein
MDDTQLSIIKQVKVRLYTHYKQLPQDMWSYEL